LEYKIAEQEAPPGCFKSCKQWQDVTKICQKPDFILVMPSLHKEYKVWANWKATSYLSVHLHVSPDTTLTVSIKYGTWRGFAKGC